MARQVLGRLGGKIGVEKTRQRATVWPVKRSCSKDCVDQGGIAIYTPKSCHMAVETSLFQKLRGPRSLNSTDYFRHSEELASKKSDVQERATESLRQEYRSQPETAFLPRSNQRAIGVVIHISSEESGTAAWLFKQRFWRLVFNFCKKSATTKGWPLSSGIALRDRSRNQSRIGVVIDTAGEDSGTTTKSDVIDPGGVEFHFARYWSMAQDYTKIGPRRVWRPASSVQFPQVTGQDKRLASKKRATDSLCQEYRSDTGFPRNGIKGAFGLEKTGLRCRYAAVVLPRLVLWVLARIIAVRRCGEKSRVHTSIFGGSKFQRIQWDDQLTELYGPEDKQAVHYEIDLNVMIIEAVDSPPRSCHGLKISESRSKSDGGGQSTFFRATLSRHYSANGPSRGAPRVGYKKRLVLCCSTADKKKTNLFDDGERASKARTREIYPIHLAEKEDRVSLVAGDSDRRRLAESVNVVRSAP
ncbi:hypothetical protein C8F04DRAFT_1237065 [Mycena alexandri]|uniref:Uncharacterized protein n=1 Tax=Mycena alexandri TaxID=1745969 RepID=A0AAD6SJU5_9AGAR|nr:hypothetical protein C8F04DRAFT_1237065 [Mycena alexandri]